MRIHALTALLAAGLAIPALAVPARAVPARAIPVQAVPGIVQAAAPGVSVQPAGAAAGTAARVRGSEWTPGTSVQVQICGARAVHGSADCDTERGVTAMVASTGTFEAGLTVGAPPAACPCVVRVATLPGGTGALATATAPFTVEGHRVERVVRDAVPVRADVVGMEIVGGGERGELFGGTPRRTLVLQIRNAGPEPIVDAPLVVGWGAGDKADSPLDVPATGTLRPGQTATYRVPVQLPPASFGRFVVGGRYAASVPFESSFSTYPWGLLGVNLLAALLLLLGIRLALGRRAAARRRRRHAAVPAASRRAPDAAPVVEVTDLIGYLDSAARSSSGAYVVDRDELIGYLEGRRGGAVDAVDLEALDRYLALAGEEGR